MDHLSCVVYKISDAGYVMLVLWHLLLLHLVQVQGCQKLLVSECTQHILQCFVVGKGIQPLTPAF